MNIYIYIYIYILIYIQRQFQLASCTGFVYFVCTLLVCTRTHTFQVSSSFQRFDLYS